MRKCNCIDTNWCWKHGPDDDNEDEYGTTSDIYDHLTESHGYTLLPEYGMKLARTIHQHKHQIHDECEPNCWKG